MTLYEEITNKSKIEGKIEGNIEGKIEVILNGFDQDMPTSLLANITNMTESEVMDIIKKHSKTN